MSRTVRMVLLFVLLASAAFFGWRFKANYDRFMAQRGEETDTDLTAVRTPDYQSPPAPARDGTSLGVWGAGLVLSLVGAGLLIANTASRFLANRTVKALYNDEGIGVAEPDYEKAEDEWNKGHFLQAIELMREYLQKNPREQHVAIRIAEIYENDLANPLAAALEYEQVLTHKLSPERWGWAAIHLCNLYSGKLNQPDKAIDLLRRLVNEFGGTAAAEKARTRLEQLAADGVIPPLEEPAPSPGPAAEDEPPGLPPGFAPKKR